MKREGMRFVSWVSCMAIFLAGLYSGAYITSTSDVLWKRAVDVGGVAAAVVSALVASYVGWLNYQQKKEHKLRQRWEHLKPSLVTLLRCAHQASRDSMTLSEKGLLGGATPDFIKEQAKESHGRCSSEISNAVVELSEIWGDCLPSDYTDFLNAYNRGNATLYVTHLDSTGKIDSGSYFNELSQRYGQLFDATKEVTSELSRLNE